MISSATRDSRGRVQINVATEPGYYYILYRGAQPNACTFPADIKLGTTGETILFDNIPQQRRAFFSVTRVPVASPLDTDSDGSNDVTELQNPRANALNPARIVAADNGAIIAPTRALFDSISHRDNFPGAPDVREVKFLIMTC